MVMSLFSLAIDSRSLPLLMKSELKPGIMPWGGEGCILSGLQQWHAIAPDNTLKIEEKKKSLLMQPQKAGAVSAYQSAVALADQYNIT